MLVIEIASASASGLRVLRPIPACRNGTGCEAVVGADDVMGAVLSPADTALLHPDASIARQTSGAR
ncbi:hypothetical protein MARA_47920 [Mycolicibacterium arabiense]|uniref:Uncharacterized protein n=1 Tax=Mycolicibacterium arabiense TaxID=1286181 RepID=A0A7I7S352_9MYCO|nr:hypothetical protein MARA_47920 [Mycolicibacterium arabiense]